MDAAKVEIALGGHVGNVGGDTTLLAQLPDDGRGVRVVDGHEDHAHAVVEVRGLKEAVDVGDLVLGHAVGDFRVQACGGADNCHLGVGIEAVEDAAGGDLSVLV